MPLASTKEQIAAQYGKGDEEFLKLDLPGYWVPISIDTVRGWLLDSPDDHRVQAACGVEVVYRVSGAVVFVWDDKAFQKAKCQYTTHWTELTKAS